MPTGRDENREMGRCIVAIYMRPLAKWTRFGIVRFSKGSWLKAKGSKAQFSQGSQGQESKASHRRRLVNDLSQVGFPKFYRIFSGFLFGRHIFKA